MEVGRGAGSGTPGAHRSRGRRIAFIALAVHVVLGVPYLLLLGLVAIVATGETLEREQTFASNVIALFWFSLVAWIVLHGAAIAVRRESRAS